MNLKPRQRKIKHRCFWEAVLATYQMLFFSGVVSYYLSAATLNVNEGSVRNCMILAGKHSDKLR